MRQLKANSEYPRQQHLRISKGSFVAFAERGFVTAVGGEFHVVSIFEIWICDAGLRNARCEVLRQSYRSRLATRENRQPVIHSA